jgi:DNA-binding CsgD family transcriptional regulator/tetratricopeptide (TPR) repeat protein
MAGIDSSPEFIARATELAALADALERADHGHPSVVVIGGEAGVGKTRLLEEFAAASRERALVLVGRCFPSWQRGLPYAPFGDLFRDLRRKVPPPEFKRLLGPAIVGLGPIVPFLDAEEAPPDRNEAAETRAVARARFFELILGIVDRLQVSGPTVVAIDDCQWADRASLDLLGFLARCVRDGRLLLVLVLQTDDLSIDDPVVAKLGQIERGATVQRMELSRFTRSQLVALMTSILGAPPDDRFVDRVAARSDGNAFFAEELVAAVRRGEATEVPPVLDDLLRARVATVSQSTRLVLRVAALVGMAIDDDLVAAVSGFPPEGVATALHEAADRGLIVRTAGGRGGFAFRHRLLQESIARDLLPGEERRLHAACAGALEELPLPSLVAGETARHWVLADRPDRALPAMVTAGLEAERRFAFADARRYLEEALALAGILPPVGEVPLDGIGILQHAADDAVLAGDAPAAVALARRALAELGEGGDRRRAASIHDRLRWYLWEAGDREGAEQALDEALRLVPSEPPSGTRARVLGHSSWLRLRSGRLPESLALAEEAVEVARSCGALPDLAFALGVRGWVRAMVGRVDDGLSDLREALAIAEFVESPEGRGLGLAYLARVLLYVGRVEEAASTALQGLETVRAIGLERTYGPSFAATGAAAAYLAGRWDEAASLSGRSLAMAAAGPEAIWPGVVAMRLAAGRGDEALMEAGRAASDPFLAATTDRIQAAWYRLALMEANLWADPADRAEGGFEIALAAVRELPPDLLDEPAASSFALAARAAADRAETARITHDAATLATLETTVSELLSEWHRRRASLGAAVPYPEFVAATEPLVEAEVGRATGVHDPGRWEAAAEAFDRLGIAHLAAYALYRQAEATLLDGGEPSLASVQARRTAAAGPLERALEVADGIRARPLVTAARRLASRARLHIARAGTATARPGPAAVSDRPSNEAAAFIASRQLTPRELEVLKLVASGWSNGEIATALFISRKTASVHVSNVLGKLGVADRIEAASLAQRAGIEGPPPPGSVLAELGSRV